MEFVTAIGGMVGLVWAAVAARHMARWPVNPIAIGGLATILVGTVFGPSFFSVASGPIPITLDRLILGAVFGGFALRYFFYRESIRPLDRTDAAVLALIGVLVISTFTHDWSYREKLPVSRLLFFNLLPVGLYFVVKNACLNDLDIKVIVISFGLFGAYLSLTAFAECKGLSWAVFPKYINDPTVQEFLGRGRGPLHNPVINGLLIITGCCSCFLIGLINHKNRKWLVLGAVGVLIGLLGAYSTLTRIVWLSSATALFLIAWLKSNRALRIGLGTLAVIGCIMLAIIVQTGILSSFKRDKFVTETEMTKSAGLRVIFLVIAEEMFYDKPIFGHGFGQYPQARMGYLKGNHAGIETALGKDYIQHNILLSYLTETGLFGVFALSILLFTFAGVGWHTWQNPNHSVWKRHVGILLLAYVLCYFMTGMFQDTTVIPMCNMLLFFLAGLSSNVLSAHRAPPLPKV